MSIQIFSWELESLDWMRANALGTAIHHQIIAAAWLFTCTYGDLHPKIRETNEERKK